MRGGHSPALPPSLPSPTSAYPYTQLGVDNRELNLNNKLLTGDATRPQLKINDFTYRCAGAGRCAAAAAC